MLTILCILVVVILSITVYIIGLNLYRHTKEVLHNLKMLDLDRETRRQVLDATRPVYPDATGTFPLLLAAKEDKVLDPGRGLLYTVAEGLIAATAEVARPEQMRRLLQAASGWPAGAAATNLLEPPVSVRWPAEIPLKSVVSEPDIRDLVLGVTVNGAGQTETVKADMGRLVHIAVGGSSGWGKSVFLRSLAYQLALSRTPTDLVMVDLEGATLAPFARCGRLLYPIAETEKDALAVLLALQEEMENRKVLYAQYPGVDSLDAYNAVADERLTPLVAVIDEATALLGDKSVESALRTLALRARKYGLWLVMAGQDWKASSLDTAIRNQLSSRVQFKAMSPSQSRVLLEQSGAEELDVIGRAWAVVPGKSPFMMQAPIISARTIMADVSNGGARYPMPEMSGNGGYDPELAEKVRALWGEGCGLSEISERVYGYKNARKTAEIKAILGLD